MELYERYGRKQEELEKITESWRQTLDLLSALKDGQAKVEYVTVTERGWSYEDPTKGD